MVVSTDFVAKASDLFSLSWLSFIHIIYRPFKYEGCKGAVLRNSEKWKWVKVLVAQPCPTPCGPMDCSPPGSSVHRILQARILEWVAVPSFRGSSQPRGQTHVCCGSSCIALQVDSTTEPLGLCLKGHVALSSLLMFSEEHLRQKRWRPEISVGLRCLQIVVARFKVG